jgi:esterase
MAVSLYHREAGEGPPVVLLHGLFGAGASLGALARDLQPHYRVLSVDLPSHGRSAWLHAPSLPAMADALLDWMADAGVEGARLVGHSLGGKVAMEMVLRDSRRVEGLVVADIAPVAYPSRHEAVFQALAAVAEGRCASREEAAEIMDAYLEEPGVIDFLGASLRRGEDGLMHWRFDARGLREHYAALVAAPSGGATYNGPVLFLKGGRSDYLREEHRSAIARLFPSATLRVMPDCGHWLHVEQPRLFNGIVRRFLDAGT